MYHTVKVKVTIEDEQNGKSKAKSETYLVDSLSCTEAEAKVTEYFTNSTVDFQVTGVSQSKITAIIGEGDE